MFGGDRWRFDAAGWSFIGLNSLLMNTLAEAENEQSEWLSRELAAIGAKPLALFIHKPLFRNAPDDAELAATSFRYVPQPARAALLDQLAKADVRLIACGHVHQQRDVTHGRVRHIWAPSASFVIADDKRQEPIGVKETGLVEYTFQPDSFGSVTSAAAGQTNLDLHTSLPPDAFH